MCVCAHAQLCDVSKLCESMNGGGVAPPVASWEIVSYGGTNIKAKRFATANSYNANNARWRKSGSEII